MNSYGGSIKGVFELFIVGYGRDCDGTPLYTLADVPVPYPTDKNDVFLYKTMTSVLVLHSYGEESLEFINEEYVGKYETFAQWYNKVFFGITHKGEKS